MFRASAPYDAVTAYTDIREGVTAMRMSCWRADTRGAKMVVMRAAARLRQR